MAQDIWSDRFHRCALAAGFIAHGEGRLEDSRYVRALAYAMFEQGWFKDGAEAPTDQQWEDLRRRVT